MTTKLFIRFLSVSILCAMLLGFVTVLALRAFTEASSLEFRRGMALSLAHNYENGLLPENRRNFRVKTWILSPKGEILNSNNTDPLPVQWETLQKPEVVHEISGVTRWFDSVPYLTVVKLAGDPPRFLVMEATREDRTHRRNLLQIFLFGLALAFSALISTLTTFIYLRRKSREAREVLLRLENGDLKARFHIKQFDEMGSLMLDFNRMASEIERLVGRLQETEKSRRHIFQELSHDLRTPLTSLRTSIDTLASHWSEMSAKDSAEIVAVCRTEVSYFTQLLENLLFIAQIDEPRYKATTESVNLVSLLEGEFQVRKTESLRGEKKLDWAFHRLLSDEALTIPGDSHLIRRLLRNTLENAARHATSKVTIRLSSKDSSMGIQIQDDGPGMSDEEVSQFGQLRTRRHVDSKDSTHVSLGLGSVIMKRIVELHNGTLTVNSSKGGTSIEIVLPRD